MPLARWVPGLDSLLHYRRAWFRPDVQAGLSVAAIQIPTAIAYAQIAGFPPQVGLYACILPMLIYALIGSSRQLMVGPDAATAAMVAAAITPLAAGDPQRLVDLSMIVAIMVGLFSIVAGLARAGFIASFLSRPILVGYLNGIGLSLLVGQLGKLFGYEAATSGFVAGILALLENLLHIHWPTLILGSLSLLLMVLLPRRFPQLPGALCGVLLASLAAALLGLDRYGVELLGEVPAGLPQLSWPQTSLEELKSLLRDATGITVVSFCSAMLTARSFAARHGYSINPNHEFVALGLANIGAGVSQGFAISGADSRTAVNDMVGGKTQLVGVVAALVIAATLLLLNKPLGWVPMPALGAVLLLAGWGLIDVQALKGFWKLSRFEFSLCLLTTVGVLSVGVLPGIFVAVSIAVLRLLYYTYRPSDAVLGWMHGIDGQVELAKYPQATTLPGLVIYRFDAPPLLFFNADYFKQRVLAVVDGSERPNAVLLNAEAMTNLDISGLATLHEVQQILKAQGVHLSLARVTGQTLDLLQRSSMLGEIKPPLVFSSVRSGVSAYRYWLRQQERLAAQAAATSGNA
ncbi:sulfate permease [Pseudomonas aeruginosa]|uniref:SulP family inorganic anion transporter n=4 Tax=Pseudomonas aeruginosa TaxID=287 RepID=UPI0003BAE5E6|nr:SulP family inorganic anion transporter [Pseudomonas aeruginosa]ERZ24286.1 sulfate transporter [Pseudomonas aeruginosa CF5]KQK63873.1 sulfate permease [Pseudomonas aeruginosa]HCW0485885.1 SulP family inorganic anion transporter [Pseudomonas aeruginosa]